MNVDVKVVDQFSDQMWRLHNLYWIVDERGRAVHFVPNEMQEKFLREMWYLNVVIKGRQHGFTTLIDIYMLDCCVFAPNMTGGIIAHTLDDVKKIFRRKIKFPYDRLPDGIKQSCAPTNDTMNELIFSNGSEISVDTNVRSGTYNYLHISEYATISHQWPEKAKEIRAGSFNTVHAGNYIWVESTGKGKGGEFYDLVQAAKRLQRSKKALTEMDFKYHFYPWWANPKYMQPPEEARKEVFTRQHIEYFNRVEKTIGQELSLEQRAWYVAKKRWNGDEMKREFPSTEEEPFEAVLRGALFAEKMQEARERGRITRVPHEPGLAVDTWWDIGHRDKTAIWFVQSIGMEVRFIWYLEESFKDLPYFVGVLNKLKIDRKWNYRHHVGPHDMVVHEFGSGKTRIAQASQLGYTFTIGQQWGHEDQINAGRTMIPMCWFDEENCAEGIVHLEQVRREWSEHLQGYMERFRHDEHSHGASAYMLGAMMMGSLNRGRARAHAVENPRFAT